MVSQQDFLDAVKAALGYEPYGSWDASTASGTGQQHGIFHDGDPLWILAGPGTGKTEVLVLRTLRLLLMDNVRPEAIMLTTFTNRAARELHQRLNDYCDRLLLQPQLAGAPKPDLSRMWLGTLHGLASRILRECMRDSPTLITEEAAAFRFLKIKSEYLRDEELYKELAGKELRGSNAKVSSTLRAAVNRLTEDGIDLTAFSTNTLGHGLLEPWTNPALRQNLLRLKRLYERKLGDFTDFTQIQSAFLSFINDEASNDWLLGVAGNLARPGIQHLIVDEYQDTNPMQEEIYHTIAVRSGAHLTVVGDDDQSMYRFRGATTDAMLAFDVRCNANGLATPSIANLDQNRRSHQAIVDALNDYLDKVGPVASFSSHRTSKGALLAKSSVTGDHLPITVMVRNDKQTLANEVAGVVKHLASTSSITDYRQAVVLAPSTKDSIRKASFRYFREAFAKQGIPVYNPGAKNLHKDSILEELLGGLCLAIDKDDVFDIATDKSKVKHIRDLMTTRMSKNAELKATVEAWQTTFDQPSLGANPPYNNDWPHTEGLSDIFATLLGNSPYISLVNQSGVGSVDSWRLAWLQRMLAAFDAANRNSMSFIPQSRSSDQSFWTSQNPPKSAPPFKGVSPYFLINFYAHLLQIFMGGGFDEPEDDLIGLAADAVPALTVHQSKGLGFPIVFIDWNQTNFGPGAAHIQEDLLRPFKRQAPVGPASSQGERSIHDRIRQLFVAISRAKYAVCLCMTKENYDSILAGAAPGFEEIPADWLASLKVI